MSTINPAARLYDDILKILRTLTIKYSVEADIRETFETRSMAERYLNAYLKRDDFFYYTDYNEEELKAVGITLESEIIYYMNAPETIPVSLQYQLLENRRKKIVEEYQEPNDYYRMLNGQPPLNTPVTDFVYVPVEYCEKYSIPEKLPIHLIEDEMGIFYISALEANGVVDRLIEENPDKRYLQHLGTRRISIFDARNAKNFSILYLDSKDIMESVYTEFLRTYEQCRDYFMTVCYVKEYRTVINKYDNFIALCIFLMTVQQLSVKMISNGADREFYDDYSIQLLYETYGVPFNKKIDELTQKQIVQNVNLLVQNKATDKVLLDIASILGFESVNIYEYYLVKERMFDDKGRPIFLTKEVWNEKKGEYETVPDYENMYDLHFQRVAIDSDNVNKDLQDPVNRAEYLDLTLYDPFWWEDDDSYHEIWEAEYNKLETKYLGLTIPYRMTELIFESIIQFNMIFDKSDELFDVDLDLPKITNSKVSLFHSVILLCALMAKKYNISGQITYAPSKILHILEVLDQDIHKEEYDIEILKFDFDAFDPSIVEDIMYTRAEQIINQYGEYENTIVMKTEEEIRIEFVDYVNKIISYLNDPTTGSKFEVKIDSDKFVSGEEDFFIITNSNNSVFDVKEISFLKFAFKTLLRVHGYDAFFIPEYVDGGVKMRLKNNQEKTRNIAEKYLVDKSYRIVNIDGHNHDIDVTEDGRQLHYSKEKLRTPLGDEIIFSDGVRMIGDLRNVKEFYDYIIQLSSDLGSTKEEKIKAFNNIYENAKELYYFISFRMSETSNYREYYALKRLYDTIFYAKETKTAFKCTDSNGDLVYPETFEEYLKYENLELYTFLETLDNDKAYLYIDHIIYKLEDILDNVDSLYVLNDGVSPLQELLYQMITFFKSYTTDMVKLSSYMIMDWKMENTLKLIDHPNYIGKTIITKDIFRMNYSDFIKKITSKFILDSKLKLHDYIMSTDISIKNISSKIQFEDERDLWFENTLRLWKTTDGYYDEQGKFYDENLNIVYNRYFENPKTEKIDFSIIPTKLNMIGSNHDVEYVHYVTLYHILNPLHYHGEELIKIPSDEVTDEIKEKYNGIYNREITGHEIIKSEEIQYNKDGTITKVPVDIEVPIIEEFYIFMKPLSSSNVRGVTSRTILGKYIEKKIPKEDVTEDMLNYMGKFTNEYTTDSFVNHESKSYFVYFEPVEEMDDIEEFINGKNGYITYSYETINNDSYIIKYFTEYSYTSGEFKSGVDSGYYLPNGIYLDENFERDVMKDLNPLELEYLKKHLNTSFIDSKTMEEKRYLEKANIIINTSEDEEGVTNWNHALYGNNPNGYSVPDKYKTLWEIMKYESNKKRQSEYIDYLSGKSYVKDIMESEVIMNDSLNFSETIEIREITE